METTTNTPLRKELRAYNTRLDAMLRSRYGMTLRTFKLVKAVTQLAGVGAAIYAMTLGAPPLGALAMATIMVSGSEVLEILIEGEPPQ
jgi:hypothetical protein